MPDVEQARGHQRAHQHRGNDQYPLSAQQQPLSVHSICRYARHGAGDEKRQSAQSVERSEQHRIAREVVHQPTQRDLLDPLAGAHHESAGAKIAKIGMTKRGESLKAKALPSRFDGCFNKLRKFFVQVVCILWL